MNEQVTMYDVMAEQEKAGGPAKAWKKKPRPTQEDRVIDYIRQHGSITQGEAFQLGIARLAARVYDINNSMNPKFRGVHIVQEPAEVVNQYGEKVKIARYRMG